MIRRPPRSTLFPLHDALPISPCSLPWWSDPSCCRHCSAALWARSSRVPGPVCSYGSRATRYSSPCWRERSEEHTSELQSQSNIVCRLLLDKKKHTIL